jgi:cell division septation protein DedD
LPPATCRHLGAYGSKADADAVIAYLQRSQLPGFAETTTISGRQAWRVRVGPYADRAQAEAARLQAVKIRADVKAEVITLDAAAGSSAAVAATPAPTTSTPAAATTPSATSNPVRSESLPPSTPTATTKPSRQAGTEARGRSRTPSPSRSRRPPPASRRGAGHAGAPAASGVGFAVQLGAFGQANDANALRDKVRAAGFSAFVEQVRTEKGTLHRVRVGPVANRADAEQLKAQVAAKVGVAGMVRPHP